MTYKLCVTNGSILLLPTTFVMVKIGINPYSFMIKHTYMIFYLNILIFFYTLKYKY